MPNLEQSGRIDLVARTRAAGAVLRRFQNAPFDWRTGNTCLHLARSLLVSLGHKPPRIPQFRSAMGAQKAMARAGYAGLAEIFDGMLLPRIAPARMLVGDIAVLPGDDQFDAIVVAAGNGQLLGWHQADPSGLVVIRDAAAQAVAAWRV